MRALKTISVGIVYKDIDEKRGYPRDIRRLCDELSNKNIEVHKLKTFSEFLKNKNRLDIVHIFAPFLVSSMLVALYCKVSKIPYIISTLSHLMPFAMKKKSLKKSLVFILVGRYLLNGADVIHAFTESESKALRDLGITTAINNITLGIYPEDITTEDCSRDVKLFNEAKPYLIFMGRLDIYQKGIDILIEGFQQYIEKSNKYTLIICGRDWENGKEFIIDSIARNDSSSRILFLGEISEEKKDHLIAEADAFIYPSRFDGPPRPIRFDI